jgi:hypothetical protein
MAAVKFLEWLAKRDNKMFKEAGSMLGVDRAAEDDIVSGSEKQRMRELVFRWAQSKGRGPDLEEAASKALQTYVDQLRQQGWSQGYIDQMLSSIYAEPGLFMGTATGNETKRRRAANFVDDDRYLTGKKNRYYGLGR